MLWEAFLCGRSSLLSSERPSKRQLVAVRIGHMEIAFSPRGISWHLRMKSSVPQIDPARVHIHDVDDQPPRRVTGIPCFILRIADCGGGSVRFRRGAAQKRKWRQPPGSGLNPTPGKTHFGLLVLLCSVLPPYFSLFPLLHSATFAQVSESDLAQIGKPIASPASVSPNWDSLQELYVSRVE
jgi:hypothetical protein